MLEISKVMCHQGVYQGGHLGGVHIKYISRMMHVIHVLLLGFGDGQFSIDGLMQDCSNSSANALELLQSWAKPSTYLSKLLY